MPLLKRLSPWIWMILIVLSFVSISPFFHSGFFTFHDDTQVARVYEMGKSLKDGMFPVRWVQDLGYGYGYPLFNFYSPFPYYIAGLLVLIGVDALLATKITFVLGILLAAFSMFFLVRRLFNENAALIASIIYLYFPYHAVNIFVRGDLDELFAYAFLPLVFLGLFSLKDNSERSIKFNIRSILLTGVSIALVILSHNLTFYMLGLFVVLFVIISISFVKHKKVFILSILGSLFLAFLLSAFYAIPAVAEMKYTNVFSQIGGGAHYPDHFVCISQLWDSMWGFGGSTKGCVDGLSFKLGKSNILLVLLSLGFFIFSLFGKKEKRTYIVSLSLGFLLFSLYMTTEFSKFFWQILPMSSFLQYPWRFLNFAGLFISILAGAFLYLLSTRVSKQIVLIVLAIIIIITLLYNAKLFVPKEYINKSNSDYTNKTYLEKTVSKISDEYLPSTFSLKNPPRQKVELQSGVGEVDIVSNKTNYLKAQVNAQTNGIIRVNIAPFPAWYLYQDGKKIMNPSFFVNVTEGSHIIEARFIETPTEIISNILSFSGVLLVIFGIIKTYERKKTS